jgi:hypothetical protein
MACSAFHERGMLRISAIRPYKYGKVSQVTALILKECHTFKYRYTPHNAGGTAGTSRWGLQCFLNIKATSSEPRTHHWWRRAVMQCTISACHNI